MATYVNFDRVVIF